MKNKKHYDYLLAFFIPFVIFGIIIFLIFLNGKTLLVSDLAAQYEALLREFKDIVTNKSSLFYSFSKGLGGNMIGTVSYYLISPLNLIVLLFSDSNIDIAIALIILLYISLSGLTMFIYLKHHFKISNFNLLIFSSSYALMSYNICYYFHIMWMCNIVLLPILLIGIDKIIDNKKPFIYLFTLFIMILSNYYIGFMVCIFACLYFIYQLILKYKKKDKQVIKKCIINFIISSFLAGMLTMFILLPTLIELQDTVKMTSNIFEKTDLRMQYIFKLFGMNAIGSASNENVLNKEAFYIYAGMFLLPLLFLYFKNKKISKKEKMASLVFIFIFVMSLTCNYINYIWHGFAAPQCFNARYSFLFIFLLITIAYKSYLNLNNNKKDYICIIPFYLFFMIISVIFNGSYAHIYLIVISIGMFLMYLLLLYLLNHGEKVNTLFLFLALAELFFNAYVSIYKWEFITKEMHNDMNVKLGAHIAKIDDSSFYRLDSNFTYTRLDSFLYNYNGVDAFISSLNTNVLKFFSNIGCMVHINAYTYGVSTPITDSLLGIKYRFYKNHISPYYNLIDTFEISKYIGLLYNKEMTNINVYHNPLALSLGYMVNDDIYNFRDNFLQLKEPTKYNYQNVLIKSMLNQDVDVLSKVDIRQIADDHYKIKIKNKDNIYLILSDFLYVDDEFNVTVIINDKVYNTYYIYALEPIEIENTYNIGDEIDIKLEVDEEFKNIIKVSGASLNYKNLEKAIDDLKQNQLVITSFKDNHFKGTVEVTADKKVLFTTLPYEKGWTIYVDGKQVAKQRLIETFIGVDLEEGIHDIEFIFIPKGLKLGVIISSFSALLTFIYILKISKRKSN